MAPKKRVLGAPRLTEQLEKWRLDPQGNPEFMQLADDAFTAARESYGFDHAAATTQNVRVHILSYQTIGLESILWHWMPATEPEQRRQHHLKEYENLMEGLAKKEKKPFNDEYLWGEVNIEKNLRTYLAFAASVVRPRSYKSESIKFQTLTQRRQSMIYWIHRRCSTAVNRGKIWNASSEALHYSYRKLGMSAEATEKHYMTRHDLANLIEHDMWITPAPDVAQQHHLCWLMGFVCGVRPGTIAFARHREKQFLRWEDITITRTGPPGSNNFKATIVFRWLKGYRDEERKSLVFTCAGPVLPEDVMFSIPHRLLAILVRRNFLEDHTSLDSLLAGTEVHIAINGDAKQLPVVLASVPKGTSLTAGKAASCDAVSAYVNRRALDYGLPAGITHYAWRRSAGTRIAETMGPDKAREFLGHEAGSRTFETAYNQGLVALDAFSIAMGRQPVSADVLLEDESLTTQRIRQTTVAKDKWIDQYVMNDEDFKKQVSITNAAEAEAADDPDDEEKTAAATEARRTLQKYRRALRSQGRLAFQKVELEMTATSMTQEELEERRENAKKPGALQKMLLVAASGIAKDTDQQDEETHEHENSNSYRMDDLRDARELPNEEQSIERSNFTRDDIAGAEEMDQADMPAACRTLLSVLVGQEDIEKSELPCRLCQADETVETSKQEKLYMPGKLNQHLATDFHTPKSKFLREHHDKADCPYGCGNKFTGTQLLSHIYKSTTQSDEHLLAAAKDGLFALDFDPGEQRTSSAITRVKGGEAQKFEVSDPVNVPIESLVRSRNVDVNGSVSARTITASSTEQPVLRLPTIQPIVSTSWWNEHEEGMYGNVADTLQAQRRWIVNRLDENLRNLAQGRADETGTTRIQSFKSKARIQGLATLRRRLKDDLNWAWAEDQENVDQPGDEEALGEEEDDEDEDEQTGDGMEVDG